MPYAGQLLPDYLNDLNAMHEAEKTLTPQQADEYFIQLLRCTWKPETKQISPAEDGWLNITTFEARKVITASSAQRAEAFLAAREAKKGQP